MKKLNIKSEQTLCLLFSFFIPLTTLLVCFFLRELAPFGEGTLCSMDGYSQYYPMLMNMDESLKEGEVFYSFSGALGFNLWAQSAYYTNSPLWLIVYLLPHSMKLAGINLVVLLKLCLSSVFFCLWLMRAVPRKKNLYVYPVTSAVWGLSGYMIAFINQLMWADVVMLLPLVILGLDRLIDNRGRLLYIFTLALSIWCCFYLAYMVCIFAVLCFVYRLFCLKRSKEEILKLCLSFGAASLVAGGLCGISLVPVAKALSLTMASDMGFSGGIEIKYTLWEFLRQLLPFGKISLEYGAPNLYCSLAAVIAMIFSFFARDTAKRERVSSFVLVTFVSLTMSINLGEYIWHGFHYPNQLPARQSFLMIFLILTFGARGLMSEKLRPALRGTAAMVCTIGVVLTSSYQLCTQTWVSQFASINGNDGKMELLTAKDDGDLFARMETEMRKNNYPQQYHYKGIAYYSSTMSADGWNFFQALGMDRFANNVSTYYNDSYIVSRLFGIKYMLREDGKVIRTYEDALSLGYLSSEEVLSFDITDYEKGEKAQIALLKAIALDKDEKEKAAIAHLKENELKIEYFDTDVIKGKISCEKDGVFLTTLPYDGGWEIIIDGEKAETVKAAGYLTACEITEGEHTVELRYTVPGIYLGAFISLIALIGLGALIWLQYKRKKQQA